MKRILFVCTGNTCRSPMAEGIFNDYAQANNIPDAATSAGIFVSENSISRNAVEVMKNRGIDISDHIPIQISSYILNEADIILTMTAAHKEYLISNGATSTKVFTFAQYVKSDIEISDPYSGDLDIYEKTAEELEKLTLMYKNHAH